MKFQLLKGVAFALLQAVSARSQEDASVAGAARVAVDKRGRSDTDLNRCLNDCDDQGLTGAAWRGCRADCERDYGSSSGSGSNPNRRPSRRPTRRPNNDRRPNYCDYRDDFDCYPLDGVPACCLRNDGRDCPTRPPSCANARDGRYGRDYCTYSPDYDCYDEGWPRCCDRNDGEDCPSQQPRCETNPRPSPNRRPSRRPSRRPTRSTNGSPSNDRRPNYCDYRDDFDCYPADGVPACCRSNGGRDCPSRPPSCAGTRNGRVGRDYCTYSPDYDCYKKGWPKCCKKNDGENCPSQQPRCEISEEKNEDSGSFEDEGATKGSMPEPESDSASSSTRSDKKGSKLSDPTYAVE